MKYWIDLERRRQMLNGDFRLRWRFFLNQLLMVAYLGEAMSGKDGREPSSAMMGILML